jgi:hypothetical protein
LPGPVILFVIKQRCSLKFWEMISMENPYSYILDSKERKITPAMKALQDAVVILLDKKEISDIEVKELCEKSNVSRNTFYCYYDYVAEVSAERWRQLLRELFIRNAGIMDGSNDLPDDFLFYKDTMDYLLEHRDEFIVFGVKRADPDFFRTWKAEIAYQLYERGEAAGRHPAGLRLEMMASAAVSGLLYYLSHMENVTLEEVCELISGALKNC